MKKSFIYLSICLLSVATLQAAEPKKVTKKAYESEAEAKPTQSRESAMEKTNKPNKPYEREAEHKGTHSRESAMEKPNKPYEREVGKKDTKKP